ncbi:MAG: helix-turn-helix domain-containing protein [Rhizobiales bacterium]|nr:helix-turn-helix domain-containing protein [Hyphomicrobiales bacterium]
MKEPLDPDLCYRAMQAKDARFDGRFFVCVSSTGIYCRPVCPARVPKKSNCLFVPSAAAAEEKGYRSCLRCRPETAPGTPAWAGTEASVARALRLIEEGALDQGSLPALAERLGLGERHLRRLFVSHVGAGPQAVAANRRLLTARQLIHETALPLSEIAHAAGFQSLRRFNDAMLKAYGAAPGAVRRRAGIAQQAAGSIELRLGYRPPYDWPLVLRYLAGRAIPGVEVVDDESYQRTFRLGGATGWLRVTQAPKGHGLLVRIHAEGRLPVRQLVARLRRLFDLDADPDAIAKALAHDPLIGPRLRALPGLRVPGAFDGFELAIRAILGQQISVKGATTISGRLAARHGRHIETDVPSLRFVFPDAEALSRGDLSGLGLTGGRMNTLTAMARAVHEGRVDFSPAESLDAKIESFCALPGIGEWTAHYVALRAIGEPDAFPASDLALRKAAGDGEVMATKALEALSQHWRPWRGYAALALWMGGIDADDRKAHAA